MWSLSCLCTYLWPSHNSPETHTSVSARQHIRCLLLLFLLRLCGGNLEMLQARVLELGNICQETSTKGPCKKNSLQTWNHHYQKIKKRRKRKKLIPTKWDSWHHTEWLYIAHISPLIPSVQLPHKAKMRYTSHFSVHSNLKIALENHHFISIFMTAEMFSTLYTYDWHIE